MKTVAVMAVALLCALGAQAQQPTNGQKPKSNKKNNDMAQPPDNTREKQYPGRADTVNIPWDSLDVYPNPKDDKHRMPPPELNNNQPNNSKNNQGTQPKNKATSPR